MLRPRVESGICIFQAPEDTENPDTHRVEAIGLWGPVGFGREVPKSHENFGKARHTLKS